VRVYVGVCVGDAVRVGVCVLVGIFTGVCVNVPVTLGENIFDGAGAAGTGWSGGMSGFVGGLDLSTYSAVAEALTRAVLWKETAVGSYLWHHLKLYFESGQWLVPLREHSPESKLLHFLDHYRQLSPLHHLPRGQLVHIFARQDNDFNLRIDKLCRSSGNTLKISIDPLHNRRHP